MPWTFYPAFLATTFSISAWTYFVYKEYRTASAATLSELGAARKTTLAYFRTVLWTCGPLFAITMFFYVLPRINHPMPQTGAWSLTFTSEMLLGVFPAIGKTKRLHDILAFLMGFGMLSMAYLFCLSFEGRYLITILMIAALMTSAAILTRINAQNFVFYELSFIFLAHISIIIAVMALT